jgi:AGCS family alanine or glycine:cation symporter
MLFAFSTMISWAYYGLQGFIYLVGPSARAKLFFNLLFCVFVVIGCAIQLQSVLNFSDAMVFAMALANVFALYLLAPEVKADLKAYWAKRR